MVVRIVDPPTLAERIAEWFEGCDKFVAAVFAETVRERLAEMAPGCSRTPNRRVD